MTHSDSNTLEAQATCPKGHETVEHIGQTHYDGEPMELFACAECGAYWREHKQRDD